MERLSLHMPRGKFPGRGCGSSLPTFFPVCRENEKHHHKMICQKVHPSVHGKIFCFSKNDNATAVHPHVCGENPAGIAPDAPQIGSSPRVWGKWFILLPQFNTCSAAGVFDRLLVKKSFDLLWLFLNASHMGSCMFLKLSIPFCRRSFGKGRFQIPVQ